MLLFEPITMAQQEAYLARLRDCPQKTSDYSFINLWAWAPAYGLEWSWSDDLVWIRQQKPRSAYWAPVGAWDQMNWTELLSRFKETESVFLRVPDALLRLWREQLPDAIEAAEERADWDYIYDMQALIELNGNRYHKKKNLLYQFQKKYSFDYIPLGLEDISAVQEMQDDWCTWRDCASSRTLANENQAIERVLAQWRNLRNLSGGALCVEGRMVAYSIGEFFSADTHLIHFEKGKSAIKGVYQAIHQLFLSSQPLVPFVNREQDLGDEGLRKAKLSYHPIDFLKKNRVVLKP